MPLYPHNPAPIVITSLPAFGAILELAESPEQLACALEGADPAEAVTPARDSGVPSFAGLNESGPGYGDGVQRSGPPGSGEQPVAPGGPAAELVQAEVDAEALAGGVGAIRERLADLAEFVNFDDRLAHPGEGMAHSEVAFGRLTPGVLPAPPAILTARESQAAMPGTGYEGGLAAAGGDGPRIAPESGRSGQLAGPPGNRTLSRTGAGQILSAVGPESFSGDLRPKDAPASAAGPPSSNSPSRGSAAVLSAGEPGLPSQLLHAPAASPLTVPANALAHAHTGSVEVPTARAGREYESDRGPETSSHPGLGALTGAAGGGFDGPIPGGSSSDRATGTAGPLVSAPLGAGGPLVSAPLGAGGTAPAAPRAIEPAPSTVAAAQMAAPVQELRPDSGSRFPAIAVRVESDAAPGNPSPAPVDVLFEQRGRELNISVRSADPVLSNELRQSLPELSQRLDQEGFDARFAAAPERIHAAASSDLRDLGAEGGGGEQRGGNSSPGGQERESGRGQTGGRNPGERDAPRRPLQWLEELTRQTGFPEPANWPHRNP